MTELVIVLSGGVGFFAGWTAREALDVLRVEMRRRGGHRC